jgi:DNA modification methylase
MEYQDFLKSKIRIAGSTGFSLNISEVNPALKPHNKLMVKWMVEGGRRACFAAFGLHKTVCQLETLRIILTKTGGRGLIICPLGVRQEFINDSKNVLGWDTAPKFIRSIEEAGETGIYLTNYETVRDLKLDPRLFQAASLDEASVLRGFGSSKTFREFMRLFTGDGGPNGNRRSTQCVPYRFIATATPDPNDHIELLAYADFLGIMDVSQAKTRFFKRDSTQADKLTLHKHKEEEFWMWVSSWALFISLPSDITGDPSDDEGYVLPELDIHWHELPSDHSSAGFEKNGQKRLFKNTAVGLVDAAREKRESLPSRIAKMLELRKEDPSAHRIIWHDLEAERHAIEKALPDCATVYGTMDLEEREKIIADFSYGRIPELGGKPVMIGSGTNLQRYCSWAIYLGIGFKFNDFIQSVMRLQRFLQQNRVRVDLIYTEAERQVRKNLERKWSQHNKKVKIMTDLIKEFGLSHGEMAKALTRGFGVDRITIVGNNYHLINNDSVIESRNLQDNSVGLILTSIPFSTQYEYSPNYSDFGHSENNDEFFGQMDYLTPELYRSLMPGRIAAIHVKDRIVPGGMTGLGFQTVYPFHKHVMDHYIKHGFAYIGMKTIVTDVVRENNQTYRLGWTEQCKDGSKMGVGMPEYLLLFRKPVTDPSNGYADVPVTKSKEDYSLSKWQVDAHGFTRASGNRPLMPEEIAKLDHNQIFKFFRDYSLNCIYDFEYHVEIGDTLMAMGKLPTTFMLLQPQSWSDEVWTDITRMRTLNGSQHAKGKELHLCPMQIELAQRVIKQMSNPGDRVLDPFGGLMTVPVEAILQGRYGIGIELNHQYFLDGAAYCKAAEHNKKLPTLFDLVNV